MRLKDATQAGQQRAADDLEVFLRPSAPSQVCGEACPDPKSMRCHRDCPAAPEALSSEPQEFPVEAGIVSLVFELKRSGAFDPCWSCEGHLDAAGKFWKTPRVWLYAWSLVHIRVLAGALGRMWGDSLTKYEWSVIANPVGDDNLFGMFAIEPRLIGASPQLHDLRKDISLISEVLSPYLSREARFLSKDKQPNGRDVSPAHGHMRAPGDGRGRV